MLSGAQIDEAERTAEELDAAERATQNFTVLLNVSITTTDGPGAKPIIKVTPHVTEIHGNERG